MTQRSIEIASPKVMKFRHVRAHADAASVAPRGDERQQAMSAVNVGAASRARPRNGRAGNACAAALRNLADRVAGLCSVLNTRVSSNLLTSAARATSTLSRHTCRALRRKSSSQ